jgi:hypothetical protein
MSFSSGWRPWSCTCATLPRAAAIVGRGGGWCCSLVLSVLAWLHGFGPFIENLTGSGDDPDDGIFVTATGSLGMAA